MGKLASPALHAVYDVAGAVMTHEQPEDYFTHLAGRVAHVNDRGIGSLYFRLKGALTHIC